MNIDAILQETTIYRRRLKLSSVTDGLGMGDAYGATLDRINGQGGERARLGMTALMWISHAERPLKPDELCHALAVEIGSPNLNSDNIPSIRTLLGCCQGLVFIDKEASIVRLIHSTLQEYLRAHPQLFGAAHSTIAETCLSYLNSQQVMALSAIPSPDPQNTLFPGYSPPHWRCSRTYSSTPFLEYSSLYWGIHAKRELSDCAKLLARKLFDDHNSHISAIVLLKAQMPYVHPNDFHRISLFRSLHSASIFGIDEIVVSLVEVEGCDINQKDCLGNTPLVYAARNGHEGVVKILLGQNNASPDMAGKFGYTPLWCAAGNGHEGVVKVLLERDDVNPEKPTESGTTPLAWAVERGHEGVVKILLGREDVNPEKPDNRGKTPLWYAARYGQEGVVKILLRRDDVNPNKPNKIGRTPLSQAIQEGHAGVVALLQPLASTNPSAAPVQEVTIPITPADYRYNNPYTTSTRSALISQARPPRPLPPTPHSRTASSRVLKRRHR